jgi:fatty acid desaturase
VRLQQARLAFFPLMEAFCLGMAFRAGGAHWAAALGFCLLASLFLSYSVHITFHEIAHQTSLSTPRLFAYPITLLMGIPFDGYRVHHFNHHAHNNNWRDFSSTWRLGPQGLTPRNPWHYVLGWPLYLAATRKSLLYPHRRKQVPVRLFKGIREQKFLLLAAWAALAAVSPWFLLFYLVTVYGGWCWISLHNYLQHPPVPSKKIQSFRNPAYNLVFCNNGLHAEHHAQPGAPWPSLQKLPGKAAR